MIGVFDSGEGGLCAVDEIKRLCPDCDIAFHRDEKNAPYGTKARSEIVRLVKQDIKILAETGADKILIACCTASAVYPLLSRKEKEICLPIITPTAHLAAKATKTKRIGIICTEATARSGAFEDAIRGIDPNIKTKTIPRGELVTLVEGGARDSNHTAHDLIKIKRLTEELIGFNPDTVILGCTHFSRIGGIIGQIFAGAEIIDSAKVGARLILEHQRGGEGKMIYV